uniref:Uncharacterized protein n=1 Tax=Onchocerca volvulus TaxID=6282 RepID=A0A8R1XX88_ONCVO
MTYSGSLFVQFGYWIIETFCLEHFDQSQFNLLRRQFHELIRKVYFLEKMKTLPDYQDNKLKDNPTQSTFLYYAK